MLKKLANLILKDKKKEKPLNAKIPKNIGEAIFPEELYNKYKEERENYRKNSLFIMFMEKELFKADQWGETIKLIETTFENRGSKTIQTIRAEFYYEEKKEEVNFIFVVDKNRNVKINVEYIYGHDYVIEYTKNMLKKNIQS
jgi:hypothetical protein